MLKFRFNKSLIPLLLFDGNNNMKMRLAFDSKSYTS